MVNYFRLPISRLGKACLIELLSIIGLDEETDTEVYSSIGLDSYKYDHSRHGTSGRMAAIMLANKQDPVDNSLVCFRYVNNMLIPLQTSYRSSSYQ